MISMKRFVREESGPTAVEYAVMLALILVVTISAIATVGNSASSMWKNNSIQISSAVGS